MEEKLTPLFLVNGFLDSGKTQFLKFTMEQEYFQTEGKTLLIVCEYGEEEYEKSFLEKYNTVLFEAQSRVQSLLLCFFKIKLVSKCF